MIPLKFVDGKTSCLAVGNTVETSADLISNCEVALDV